MRIAFISSHAGHGGSERYLERLVAAFPDDVAGVVSLEDGPLVARLRERGVAVDIVATGTRPRSVLAARSRLAAAITALRPDVVHANGVKAAVAAGVCPLRRPVVWVKHDIALDGPVAWFAAVRSARVVAVSAFVARTFPGPLRRRVTVVHTGIAPTTVDASRGRAVLEETTGSPGPFVIVVARLDPAKGHRDVIAAMEVVRGTHPSARAVFVGGPDPTQPGEHAALEALAGDGGVALLGQRDDAVELAAGADVAVIASRSRDDGLGAEGFPLVALEYLAVGTPVVAYDAGGVAEALGPCGRLVEVGDVGRLGTEIASVLSDRAEADQLAACGRRRASTELDETTWLRSLRSVYEDVVR